MPQPHSWKEHGVRGRHNPRAGSQRRERFMEGQQTQTRMCTAGPQSSCSIPEGSRGKEGGRRGGPAPHLGGSEDDDVLHVPPGEAWPHLQHQCDHPRGQRGSGRRPRVTLRAARALLQVPVCCHLPRNRGQASVSLLCCAGVAGQVHVVLAASCAPASQAQPARSQSGRVPGTASLQGQRSQLGNNSWRQFPL